MPALRPILSVMSKSKNGRKRSRRSGPPGRRRGGLMLGMRSGFKGIAGAVASEDRGGKHRWLGHIITLLLVAAAIGLLAYRL
jgi:hypothetical protein